MPEYKNSPERFADFRKQFIAKIVPVMLIVTIGSFCISYFSGEENTINLYVSLAVTLFALVIFGYIVTKNINQQKIIYDSFKLIVGPDYLSRTQSNLPPVTLFFHEISKITETKQGYLRIDGLQKNQFIIISPYLEEYSELKRHLQLLQPFNEQEASNIFLKIPLLLPLITIGSMAAIYISNNKIIVAVSGIILMPLLAWSFYKMRSIPQSDNPLAKNKWLLLIVLLSIMGTIYYKLFAL